MSELALQVGVKVLLKQGDKYLFLRREPKFKAGPQKWDIPGGRIEPDEPLEEALAREVSEETGLTLEKVDKLLAAQDIFVPGKDIHVVRLTYVGGASGEVAISDEHDDYKWLTLEEILAEQHIDPYLIEVLESIGEALGASKLVRDRIPEIIRNQGGSPRVESLASHELERFVDQKILEEAGELSDAETDADVLEEAADLIEILMKKLTMRELSMEDVELARQKKLDKRGGFDEGYVLYRDF